MTIISEPGHYFVDESGDGVIFNDKGQVLLGKEGCMNYFILGLLEVKNPAVLEKEMAELRENLKADPYFKNVPSFEPAACKTAVYFHAKDDLPEVRREVFTVDPSRTQALCSGQEHVAGSRICTLHEPAQRKRIPL